MWTPYIETVINDYKSVTVTVDIGPELVADERCLVILNVVKANTKIKNPEFPQQDKWANGNREVKFEDLTITPPGEYQFSVLVSRTGGTPFVGTSTIIVIP
ncbi:hypothetical protein Hte_012074 [Hypoxylon texense]